MADFSQRPSLQSVGVRKRQQSTAYEWPNSISLIILLEYWTKHDYDACSRIWWSFAPHLKWPNRSEDMKRKNFGLFLLLEFFGVHRSINWQWPYRHFVIVRYKCIHVSDAYSLVAMKGPEGFSFFLINYMYIVSRATYHRTPRYGGVRTWVEGLILTFYDTL